MKIGFHDRWLKYKEMDELQNWSRNNPRSRIIEVDQFQCAGISDISEDPSFLNVVTFTWNPNNTMTEAYIRVNCSGSEFTRKKQGGEKGASFELQAIKIVLKKCMFLSLTEN